MGVLNKISSLFAKKVELKPSEILDMLKANVVSPTFQFSVEINGKKFYGGSLTVNVPQYTCNKTRLFFDPATRVCYLSSVIFHDCHQFSVVKFPDTGKIFAYDIVSAPLLESTVSIMGISSFVDGTMSEEEFAAFYKANTTSETDVALQQFVSKKAEVKQSSKLNI